MDAPSHPTNPKLHRSIGGPFSSTSLRKIFMPGLSRVWKHFPKNRFSPSLPPSPTNCPLHPHPTTSMDHPPGGQALNLNDTMTFSHSMNDRSSQRRVSTGSSPPTPLPTPVANDPGRGNNNSYVVLVPGSSKCKKRCRTNLAPTLSHFNLGDMEGGRKSGFSLKLGRATTRKNLKLKRRLAQTLNNISPIKSLPTESEMITTPGSEHILEPQRCHDLTPALWNKYHSLDTTCGLIVVSPPAITELCSRPAAHTHLELLMDAQTLAFEAGDNRCGPKYADAFGWSEDHKSPNIAVSRGESGAAGAIAKRYPVAMSTDAVRGAVGLGRGLHVWRVDWPITHRGTQAVVGVILDSEANSSATASDTYRADGYRPLVGARPDSWGWDLVTRRLYDGDMQHDPTNTAAGVGTLKTADLYPQMENSCLNGEAQVYVVLERGPDSGTLGYWSQGGYMGHAFRSPALKAVTTDKSDSDENCKDLVYPIVSAVWGHCEMQLHYVDGIEDGPLSLKLLSRFVIRKKTPFIANIQARCPDLKIAECQIDVPRQLLQYLLA